MPSRKRLNHTLVDSRSKTKKRTQEKPKTLLDTVKIGKYLNKGKMGTIYLATDPDGNKYAYKIGKMFPREVKKSAMGEYWRENDFAEQVANKYPDQFMQLYDSRIESACKHTQDFSGFDFIMEDLPKARQNYYKRLNASPYCSIKLWSLIDGDLEHLLIKNVFDTTRFYDIFIQIVYIVYLMNHAGYFYNDFHPGNIGWDGSHAGYFHNDFHPGNIGWVKTDQKTIDILGHPIPTHGYLMKAIDFGLVLHDKYPLSKTWREKYNNDNDLFTVFNLLSLNCEKDNKYDVIKIGKHTWIWGEEWVRYLKLSATEKAEMANYLPERKLNKDNTRFFTDKLFKLIHYETWQRRVLNDESLTGVAPPYMIPLPAILYLVKHIYEPKKVLEYLIKHRVE